MYGINGFCEDSFSDESCITFRGGQFSALESTTSETIAKAIQVDGPPYPSYDLHNDTLTLNGKTSLSEFPIGVPLNNWGAQGYHPQAALGLGYGSTLLQRLKSRGVIASKTWSFFWGRTGATAATQLDGSLVLGGYDKAKVVGNNHTDRIRREDSGGCTTGILPKISDMILNFPNGTNASLLSGKSKSTVLRACIVPDYPVLMTIPTDPYFNSFRAITNAELRDRSFGLNFFSMVYGPEDNP